MSGPSRREVVRAAVGVGVMACVGCGSDPGSSTAIAAGKVSDYSVSTLKGVSGWSLYVGRDAGGLYAMSSLCTHQGCDMGGATTSRGPYCSCHASQFDVVGNVLSGPARSALTHFAVTVDATTGAVTVDGTKVVSQSTRVAV